VDTLGCRAGRGFEARIVKAGNECSKRAPSPGGDGYYSEEWELQNMARREMGGRRRPTVHRAPPVRYGGRLEGK